MKRNVLALAAIVFALGSAFTAKPFATWYFMGSTSLASDRVDPTKYQLSNPGYTCGTPNNELCTINASGSSQPSIPANSALYNNLNNSGGTAPVYNSDITGRP